MVLMGQASYKDGRYFWHRKAMGCHLWREPTTWGFWFQKKVTGHRIFLGGLHTWEMKNFVRRWWKSHDTPEFQRSIVAGTIRRCTWSVSERACQFVIIMWLMGRETSSTSLRMCRNILKCVSKSLCGFLRFGQPSTSDFLWLSKRNVFPIVQSVSKNTVF